jgi:hypothetical protein
MVSSAALRHCEEPTGPSRSGRPDDRLSDEAIQKYGGNTGLLRFARNDERLFCVLQFVSILTIIVSVATMGCGGQRVGMYVGMYIGTRIWRWRICRITEYE